MPSVPQYGQSRVQRSGTPNARVQNTAPDAAFGIPSRVDLSGAAKVMGQKAQEEADYADQIVINAAERRLADKRSQSMASMMNRRGHDALNLGKEVEKEWRTFADEVIGTLKNDRQRERVSQRERGMWDGLYSAVESHASSESRKADADDVEAMLSGAVRDVDSNPESAETAIADVTARVSQFGKRNGWAPNVTEQYIAKRVSGIHSTAINRLIEQERYGEAQGYFNAYSAELVGRELQQATKIVEAGIEEGGVVADVNAALTPQQQGVEKTPAEVYADANAIPDLKRRKAVLSELDDHYARIAKQEKKKVDAAYERIGKNLNATGKLNRASADWMALGTDEQWSLLQRQKARNKPDGEGVGDPDKFMHLLNLSAIPGAPQAEFVATDILSLKGISDAQKRTLIAQKRTILERVVREEESAENAKTVQLQREYKDAQGFKDNEAAITVAGQKLAAHMHAVDARRRSDPAPAGGTGPMKQATPEQLADIVKHGPGYAAYLRSIGVATP